MYNLDNKLNIIVLMGLAILFTLTITKFILYQYEIVTLKETNELLMKNNEFCTKVLDDYRIMKHNLISKLLGIKSVSNKKAKFLIDDLIKEYNTTFKTTKNIKDIPYGLEGIIYEKFYNFNEKELLLTVENKMKHKVINSLTPRNYNLLCEALGVNLDNAMEASANSKEKIIYLKFNETKDKIKITIMNSFAGKIDIDKLGSKNYTSKKKGHGLGLFSLMNRKSLLMKTSIKNNLFKNVLIIDKVNKKEAN